MNERSFLRLLPPHKGHLENYHQHPSWKKYEEEREVQLCHISRESDVHI